VSESIAAKTDRRPVLCLNKKRNFINENQQEFNQNMLLLYSFCVMNSCELAV
jgi:hypothetical protein